MYHDIVILEEVVKDNIDEGKSIEYFRWLARKLPDPKPKFGKSNSTGWASTIH